MSCEKEKRKRKRSSIAWIAKCNHDESDGIDWSDAQLFHGYYIQGGEYIIVSCQTAHGERIFLISVRKMKLIEKNQNWNI